MYLARKVAIEGYGSELMISTDDLESVLINEAGAYTSTEARFIDEQIFFYVLKRIAVDESASLILVGTGSLHGEGFDHPRRDTLFM